MSTHPSRNRSVRLVVRLALAVALTFAALGVRPAFAAGSVELSYNGPGSVLRLEELSSTAIPITIREPRPGALEMHAGQQGRINTASGAVLAVANLALQAGSGIGTSGAMA